MRDQNRKEFNKKTGHVCPICNQEIVAQTILENEEVEILNSRKREEMEVMEDEINKEIGEETKPYQGSRIGPSNEMYIPMSSNVCDSRRSTDPLKLLSIGETDAEMKVDVLKKQLNDVILLSKVFMEKGIGSLNIADFLKACENVKARIEKLFKNKVPIDIDDRIQNKLSNLKGHLREVLEITKELRDDTFLSPSVENFTRICEEVDNKINICMKRVEAKPVTDVAKSRLFDLKNQINDVVKITEGYKERGLLAPSAEKFLQSCEVVKSKIDLYTKESVDGKERNIDNLKKHLKTLEEMATDVKQEGLISPSIENFLTSCKEFKDKLDDYKNKDTKPPTEDGLHKLVSQLDETISLSKEAKQSGLVSESVDKFIKSCEDLQMKIKLREKDTVPKSQPKVLDKLKFNIDDVMKMVNKCQAEGLITKSMENFIKSLEITKSKIDVCKKLSPKDSEFRIIYPSCSDACTCGDQADPSDELCDGGEKQLKESPIASNISPPCEFCRGILKEPSTYTRDLANFSYTNPNVKKWADNISPDESQHSEMCEVCKRYMKEEQKAIEEAIPKEPPPVDSSLGYFEKNVRKITKVTRTQNSDGTIREETEIITIRKERHDPNETSFHDDDDKYEDATSCASLFEEIDDKKDQKAPDQDQRGVLGKSRSECCARMENMTEPTTRQSNSLSDFRFK